MIRRCLPRLLFVLLCVAGCGGDVETTPGGGGSGGSSSGGSAGSAAAGGSGGGTCPVDPPAHTGECADPGLQCSYSPGCCACTDIGCGVLWLCADPLDNDSVCPATPPGDSACSTEVMCEYCAGGEPVYKICNQGQWADGIPVGCM